MKVSRSEIRKIPNKPKNNWLETKYMYTFDIVLCDNDIDSDGERFTSDSLFQMAQMFPGKRGYLSDSPNKNSVATIMCCTVVKQLSKKNQLGLPLLQLKARAFIDRKGNEAIIDDIESGRIKYVSVGVAVGHVACSICHSAHCDHVLGTSYNGKLCYKNLDDISEVYEFGIMFKDEIKPSGTWSYKDYDLPGYTERRYYHSDCSVNPNRLYSAPDNYCAECGAKMQAPNE